MTSKNDLKGQSLIISCMEMLIINIPVFMFILGIGLCTCLGLIMAGLQRIFCVIGCWWSLSGAVMLSLDYKRKRRQYLHLIRCNRISGGMAGKLKQTLCGCCLYLGFVYRMHSKGVTCSR